MDRGRPSTKSSSSFCVRTQHGVNAMPTGRPPDADTYVRFGRVLREQRFGLVQRPGVRALVENERLALRLLGGRRRRDQPRRLVPLTAAGVAHGRRVMFPWFRGSGKKRPTTTTRQLGSMTTAVRKRNANRCQSFTAADSTDRDTDRPFRSSGQSRVARAVMAMSFGEEVKIKKRPKKT